jgi:hypothetical protein
MTIEYVLLLVAVFMFGLKAFVSAPSEAFRSSGPYLAARIEQQVATGDGFTPDGKPQAWQVSE